MPTREDIIHDILSKKELAGIEHSFVSTVLDKELLRQPKIAKKIDSLSTRSADYKDLIKAVRAVLRRNIMLYEGDPRHREVLLDQLRQSSPSQRKEIIAHILSTHASTRERLRYYDQMYDKLFAITGNPKVVLDIGCGLNPLSYPDRNVTYIGIDIYRKLCLAVEKYFRIVGMEGECRVVDVRGIEQIKHLPKADVAFAFKLLDLVKQKGLAESIITALPAKWIVVSFPTITSSGAPMRFPRRAWIEKLLERLGHPYKQFRIPNEIFYVIDKQ